jgi:hypothetical protein
MTGGFSSQDAFAYLRLTMIPMLVFAILDILCLRRFELGVERIVPTDRDRQNAGTARKPIQFNLAFLLATML